MTIWKQPARVNDRLTVWRYAGVSLQALMLDLAITAGLTSSGLLPPVAASSLGFCAGAGLAYAMTSHWAFKGSGHRMSGRGFLLFSAVGIGGLVVNSGIVWAGTGLLGLAWQPAKLAAAGCSFLFNYSARKALLYSPRPEPHP